MTELLTVKKYGKINNEFILCIIGMMILINPTKLLSEPSMKTYARRIKMRTM